MNFSKAKYVSVLQLLELFTLSLVYLVFYAGFYVFSARYSYL